MPHAARSRSAPSEPRGGAGMRYRSRTTDRVIETPGPVTRKK